MAVTDARPVGRFAWNATTDRWSWDAGMYHLHGYQAGASLVSTDLVLQHKIDDHRPRAEDVLTACANGDQRFSNYHRIVDLRGRQRTVLSVGESRVVKSGGAQSHRVARGFMVDVTQDESDSTQRVVERLRERSAAIQQSIGLLMGSLGLTEDAAFAVIAHVSQHHQVKVRDLTRRFMTAAVSRPASSPRDLSQLLIAEATALSRIGSDADGISDETSRS